MSRAAPDQLIGDLRAFLDVVGTCGLPLTDTRRLRLADVRTVNARIASPEQR